jgi:TraY domain-containing protein
MSESRFIAALVPPSMRAELERSAAENERTLSGEIRLALKQHLDPGGFSSSLRPALDDRGGGGSASPPPAPEQKQKP